MKRLYSQIAVAIVCALLGFFLSYQFKLISSREENKQQSTYATTDILKEVESLKAERDDVKKQNEDLQAQLKKLEDDAAKSGAVDMDIKKELDTTRMITGTVDVKGQGIILRITPKSDIFSSNKESAASLDELELIHLINSLWFARAEAISINDYRLTPQTGIKNSGSVVNIGSEGRVDPSKEIIIKAIGDKNSLDAALKFANTLNFQNLGSYKKEIEPSDEIVIKKSVKGLNSNYIKPVK
ncbi:DUF881 domain-containing protein [Clostridium intestinale]|uniref:Division initiation protein n=3 Tax=Clostridium intestinale TaxID=36845 RepID=U2PWM3_9CLOT|nr:DUF881 domain-containing protein [Clostridium intestinale]ERK30865.1 hypothetical protein CINTURNW_1402 [Clostridium intestinale URNW]QLY78331.1 DUF881 domain-containing protein [Clostridium intestinale]SHI17736.1 Uncharacterized conserved protein YlxW, UPF0749 family [Clostridium intestinale DSM 6191]